MVDGPERGVKGWTKIEQERRVDDQAVEAQPDEGANLRSGHSFARVLWPYEVRDFRYATKCATRPVGM